MVREEERESRCPPKLVTRELPPARQASSEADPACRSFPTLLRGPHLVVTLPLVSNEACLGCAGPSGLGADKVDEPQPRTCSSSKRFSNARPLALALLFPDCEPSTELPVDVRDAVSAHRSRFRGCRPALGRGVRAGSRRSHLRRSRGYGTTRCRFAVQTALCWIHKLAFSLLLGSVESRAEALRAEQRRAEESSLSCSSRSVQLGQTGSIGLDDSTRTTGGTKDCERPRRRQRR